ncbi:MAG: oligosaccharide flippase family protein [Bacteroidales bacterium]|nr:oligosaccharide flippase family protein [Bacteroidales bacterium]
MNKVLKNSLLYFSGKIVQGIFGFLFILILIRIFGKDIYGEYSLVISAIVILSSFFAGWLNQSYIRFYSENSGNHGINGLYLKLLFFICLAVIILLSAYLFIKKFSVFFILLTAGNFLLYSLFTFFSFECQIKFMPKKLLLAEIIRNCCLIAILCSVFIFKEKNQVNFLLFINILSYSISIIYLKSSSISLIKTTTIFKTPFPKDELVHALKFGLPLAFWMLFSYLLYLSDRYIIAWYHKESLGTYTAVYDILSKISFVAFSPVLTAFQPFIISFYNEGKRRKPTGTCGMAF